MFRLRLLFRIGILNVIKVFIYRLQCASSFFAKFYPVKKFDSIDVVFLDRDINEQYNFDSAVQKQIQYEADSIIQGKLKYFFNNFYLVGSPPDWLLNPLVNKTFKDAKNVHWSKNKFFNAVGADIKVIWEPSRFYWLTTLARAAVVTQQDTYIDTINIWLRDWMHNNPINSGYNWMCGQEVAIRLINTVLASYIINTDKDKISKIFIDFVVVHAERILYTMHYAKAQQNNHATSEAAALFLVGIYLQYIPGLDKINIDKARKFQRIGIINLEQAIASLIQDDGSFAQYSVNYHRLVLDTMSLVVLWGRKFTVYKKLSSNFYDKYNKAFLWLYSFVDLDTGSAANVGNNDGSMLFCLHSCDYRDFRPSLQLASILLNKAKVFPDGPWDEPLTWLCLDSHAYPVKSIVQQSRDFNEGGFVKFCTNSSWALLRYPRYKFRPSQADILHFDLWIGGVNLLCDGGSYKYNCDPETLRYFLGIKSHNTVQFDDRGPMPVISRFLYGAWPKCKVLRSNIEDINNLSWQGEYADYQGCYHKRCIEYSNHTWIIIDYVSGYKSNAILRWHLADIAWQEQEYDCRSNIANIEIYVNGDKKKIILTSSKRSLYYHEMHDNPAIEIKSCASETTFKTVITLLGVL